MPSVTLPTHLQESPQRQHTETRLHPMDTPPIPHNFPTPPHTSHRTVSQRTAYHSISNHGYIPTYRTNTHPHRHTAYRHTDIPASATASVRKPRHIRTDAHQTASNHQDAEAWVQKTEEKRTDAHQNVPDHRNTEAWVRKTAKNCTDAFRQATFTEERMESYHINHIFVCTSYISGEM